MNFQWRNWKILAFGEFVELGSLMWALWEQRECPLAWLLLVGFALQIASVFFLISPTPWCCEYGKYSPRKLKRLIQILCLCDAGTFTAIAIPAFGCGNLEDAMGALFSLVGALFSAFCDYTLGPDLWKSDSPPPEAGIVLGANTSEEPDINKYIKLVDDLLLEAGLKYDGVSQGEFKYPLAWNNMDSGILSTRVKHAFLQNLNSHDPAYKVLHEEWLGPIWENNLQYGKTTSSDESIGIGNLKIEFKSWKNVRKKSRASRDDSWQHEDLICFEWKFTRKSQMV